jgi:hypothetical protein
VVLVAVGLLGLGGLVLTGSRPARARARSGVTSEAGCVSEPSATASPQCLRAASRLPRRRASFGLSAPGTVARSSAVFGVRVFLNAKEGVALADGNNAEYPALSTDGGQVWRIDGPPLHVDAADGAEAVGSVGIAGPRTFFAYGSSVVDVTTDRGRTWWETYLGENVVVVVPSNGNELLAYVEQSVNHQHLNPAATWQYISRDGGRHWHYSTQFAGIPG